VEGGSFRSKLSTFRSKLSAFHSKLSTFRSKLFTVHPQKIPAAVQITTEKSLLECQINLEWPV
jgi:hypothetical protein